MFENWNPSPIGSKVGDCAVRAVAKALGVDWDEAYMMLCIEGYKLKDMPNSNAVIHALLKEKGFRRDVIPDMCPDCYTIADFAEEHPNGTYIVGTGSHVVAVQDGTIYDSWDSSQEIPLTYWTKIK